MRIHLESSIPHPRPLVYRTYRDRLPELVDHIPDVHSIEVRSRAEGPSSVQIHTEWTSRADLPAFLRPFVGAPTLRWDDHANWDDDAWSCAFIVVFGIMGSRSRWTGTNTFLAAGAKSTTIRVDGRLRIDLSGVPGIPKRLGEALEPKVQRHVASVLERNLERMNESVAAFLNRAGREP